jgi:hypothetical protein
VTVGTSSPIPLSSREWRATDDAALRNLQEKLPEVWSTFTMRTLRRVNRTVVIVPSISVDVPHSLAPVLVEWYCDERSQRTRLREEPRG